ncbi:hypothetical protein ACFQYP_18405 [Nonomuraea antimicrobica]
MTASQEAIDTGLVTPAFTWGAMAVPNLKGGLAYLTLRRTDTTTTAAGEVTYEVGVIGHGPGGDKLAHHVADLIRLWDRDYRQSTVRIDLQHPHAATRLPGAYRFELSLLPGALARFRW